MLNNYLYDFLSHLFYKHNKKMMIFDYVCGNKL